MLELYLYLIKSSWKSHIFQQLNLYINLQQCHHAYFYFVRLLHGCVKKKYPTFLVQVAAFIISLIWDKHMFWVVSNLRMVRQFETAQSFPLPSLSVVMVVVLNNVMTCVFNTTWASRYKRVHRRKTKVLSPICRKAVKIEQ